MPVSINSFSPNTKIESAKVNTNFANVKAAIDQLQSDKSLYTLTDASTVNIDLSLSKMFTLTLTDAVGANRILALINGTVGQAFVVRLVQGGTGSKTVTWWGGIKWPAASAPTLTLTAGSTDSFGFINTSVSIYDGYFLSFDLR